MASDSLRLLFELDVDSRAGTAGLLRFRKDVTTTIETVRRAITQPLKALNTVSLTAATAKVSVSTQELANRQTRATQAAQRLQIGQQRLAVAANQVTAAHQRAATAIQRAANGQTQAAAGAIRAATAYQRATVAANNFAQSQSQNVTRALNAVSSSLRSVGQGLQSAGRTLTIGITAPLLALGAASLKSAKDLDANVNTLKAFTGSAEAAERRLAQLIKTARGTPGLTTNLALTLDAQLRVAQTTEETINRVLPAIGRLNAVSKLPDAARFTQNLLQLVTQNFERQDLKELVGQSPLAGQLLTEIFKVDSPVNAKAIRESARKLGLTSVDAFFTAFAEAAARNQGLATVTESIGTRFDKIVDRITVALRPLGLAIINAIEPFIEPVAKLIEKLSAAFDSLPKPVKTIVILFAGLAAAAGPVLLLLGSIATALGTVASAIAAVGLPIFAAVIAGIIIEIGKWAAILGVLGLAWKTNFLGIRELVSDAASVVVEALGRIKAVIGEAVDRILPTLQSITTKILAVITAAWETYGKAVVRLVGGAFEFVIKVTETFIRVFGSFVDLLLKLIDGDFQGAWRAFARIIITALDAWNAFLAKLGELLVKTFLKLNVAILAGAVKISLIAATIGPLIVAKISEKLIAAAPVIRDALVTMFALAISGLSLSTVAGLLAVKFIAALRKAAAEGAPSTARLEVGGDIGGGEGIFRKKGSRLSSTDDTTKGADAESRRRIRLLEIEAEKVRTLTDAQLAQEQIAFEERKKSLEDYTAAQIKAAGDVLLAQLAVYAKEREEAKKIRNQSARDLSLAEIDQREFEAQQSFTTKVAQLEANKRKEEFGAAKAHRQALLDVQDQGDQKQLELIDSYVERYLISFEEAEKRRIAIEQNARARRKTELETQLGEAGKNVQEQQRIKDAIAAIDAEAATAKEEAENRKRRALKATLEAELDYYQTLQQITLRTAQTLRDAAQIELNRLVNRFGDRRIFRLRALELERQANEEEHRERLRQIEQEKKDAEKRLEGVRDAEEKLIALREYYANLEKAENERRAAERRDEEAREAEERDPFSSLRKRLQQFQFDIQNTNQSIIDSLASLSEQVNSSISGLVDAFKQAIVANILYGESIGKALKAALAQQLAAISAEATIQSLKHAAYAIGSLAFGNAAAAAKHAAAAAAFGALAITAGLAGRALAKSSGLFDRGNASGTASAAVAGGEPRNREFQNNTQQAQPSSVAAREGSGGFFGRVLDQIRLFQQQNLDVQRQQQLHNAQVAEALTRMRAARPGDVVTMGAGDAREAIGVAVVDHSNASGDFNEAMQRNLGFAR